MEGHMREWEDKRGSVLSPTAYPTSCSPLPHLLTLIDPNLFTLTYSHYILHVPLPPQTMESNKLPN